MKFERLIFEFHGSIGYPDIRRLVLLQPRDARSGKSRRNPLGLELGELAAPVPELEYVLPRP